MSWTTAVEVPKNLRLCDVRKTIIPGVVGFDMETEEAEILLTSTSYNNDGTVKEVKAVVTYSPLMPGSTVLVPVTIRVKVYGMQLLDVEDLK